jgi:hypothetical protein
LYDKLVEVDHILSMNMFQSSTEYKDICVRSDVSLEYFLTLLRRKWSDVAKRGSVRCPVLTAADIVSVMQKSGKTVPTYESLTALKDRSFDVSEMIDAVGARLPDANKEGARRVATRALTDKAILDILPYMLNERTVMTTFGTDETVINDVLKFLLEAGACQSYDVMMRLLRKYSARYGYLYEGRADDMDRDAVALLTRASEMITARSSSNSPDFRRLINVGEHLNELIPDSLGKFKQFIIRVIVTYYDNLHPIVASHILCQLLVNFEKVLPKSQDEIMSFLFKTTLLNSGPLILKLLQMATVAMDVPTKKKFGLERLEYPLINPRTVDEIFNNILVQPHLCDRVFDVSASVGHVRIMRWNDYIPGSARKSPKFVVKIIKAVTSAMTSCWEYELLSRTFDPLTEAENDQNIRQMLINNGEELDLRAEGAAMKKAHSLYTASYSDLFGVTYPMTLTTIQELGGVLKNQDTYWQAIAMELAPGRPLTKCVDDPKIMDGDVTQAALYRAFDMLTERFVFNLIEHGFAHSDLHAGNIFFCTDTAQMTIIDWGAVVDLNLFAQSPTIDLLRQIVLYVSFFDFRAIVEAVATFLGDEFDASSANLGNFLDKMKMYREDAVRFNLEHPTSKETYSAIFGSDRTDSEGDIRCSKSGPILRDKLAAKSIYERYDVEFDTTCETRPLSPAVQWSKLELDGRKLKAFSSNEVIVEIIQFFVENNVDVQSKFPELISFQKAYALLLGVYTTFNYNPYRMQTAILRASLTWRHWKKLVHVRALTDMSSMVRKLSSDFDKLQNSIKYLSGQRKPNFSKGGRLEDQFL